MTIIKSSVLHVLEKFPDRVGDIKRLYKAMKRIGMAGTGLFVITYEQLEAEVGPELHRAKAFKKVLDDLGLEIVPKVGKHA